MTNQANFEMRATGDTFALREQFKSHGWKWNAASKYWSRSLSRIDARSIWNGDSAAILDVVGFVLPPEIDLLVGRVGGVPKRITGSTSPAHHVAMICQECGDTVPCVPTPRGYMCMDCAKSR